MLAILQFQSWVQRSFGYGKSEPSKRTRNAAFCSLAMMWLDQFFGKQNSCCSTALIFKQSEEKQIIYFYSACNLHRH